MSDKISSDKTRTSLSITKDCSQLMTAIGKQKGISRNAVVEIAIRLLAEKERVTVTKAGDE